MFDWHRRISLIVAPHGSTRSWNRDVSLPVLLGIGAVAVLLTSRVRHRLGRGLHRLVIDEAESSP